MRLETFIRKSLGMKAHTVVKTEERPDGGLVAHVERLPGRRLCCGECGHPASQVATTRRPARRWQDVSGHPILSHRGRGYEATQGHPYGASQGRSYGATRLRGCERIVGSTYPRMLRVP